MRINGKRTDKLIELALEHGMGIGRYGAENYYYWRSDGEDTQQYTFIGTFDEFERVITAICLGR